MNLYCRVTQRKILYSIKLSGHFLLILLLLDHSDWLKFSIFYVRTLVFLCYTVRMKQEMCWYNSPFLDKYISLKIGVMRHYDDSCQGCGLKLARLAYCMEKQVQVFCACV